MDRRSFITKAGVAAGAVAATTTLAVQATLAHVVFDVTDPGFGATGDGVTDDTDALQEAIDAAETAVSTTPATGPAFVFCPGGQYIIGQITLKNRVIIVGAGFSATEFKAKDNLNDHLFLSKDFAALTGTDVCTPAEGVIHHVGFINCRINGNKANQTVGDGVRMIVKNPTFERVVIQDCKGNGLYTEVGTQCPVNDWSIVAAGSIDDLRIFGNNGHGWHMRGPHDCFVNMMKSYLNGGDGINIDFVSPHFNPTLDFNHIHTYSNTGYGMYVKDTTIKGAMLRAEDNDKEGLYFESAQDSAIAVAQILGNGKVSGSFQCVIDTNSNQVNISNLTMRKVGRTACGGLQVAGDNCHINGTIQGDTVSTGVGLDLPNICQLNTIDVTIQGFLGAGGIGLRTGQTAGINFNSVRATIQNCDTAWNNVTAGVGNHYKISGTVAAADTKFSGVGPPSANVANETWDVFIRDSTPNVVVSDITIKQANVVDLNSTAAQDFTVPHNLLVAPAPQDVTVNLEYSGVNTTWALQYAIVKSVDATNIVVRVKLSTAAGSAQTGSLLVTARI